MIVDNASNSVFAHKDDFLDLERKDLADSEVEQCFLETRYDRKSLEVLVKEQRRIATSATNDAPPASSSTRVSPSLSSSQEFLKKISPANHTKLVPSAQKGAKSTGSLALARQSPSTASGSLHLSASKPIGGVYILKGGLAMGLVTPVAVKEGSHSAGDDVETGSAASDDNDSASTTGIVPSQFASIIHDNDLGHANATYVRKQSDDIHSEGSEASAAGSYVSDRTQAEPYLTSVIEDATTHASMSKGPAGRPRVDCLDTIVSNISQVTAVIKTRKDGGDNGGNYDYTSSEVAGAADTESACLVIDEGAQFVSFHDDFTLLSDEALLSLSELRQKIRSRREMSRKIEQMQIGGSMHTGTSIKPIVRAASAPLVAPTALPVGRKTAVGLGAKKVATSHYSRSAWEEPPAGRQHGSQVKNEKMFQSVLDDAAGDSSIANFSTSPGSNKSLANFGSRPNSRGTIAADSVNASIKQAITQIIRTNVQRGEPVSITGVPLVPGVRGSGSVTRNTLRNTHIAPQSSLLSMAMAGATPLDISLAEARRLSSPLQVSPRTAFDDRSVSSTDSYRSHSSHYSSASGVSLSAREDRHRTIARPLPVKKSSLSIAMTEASAHQVDNVVSDSARPREVAVSTQTSTAILAVEFSSLDSQVALEKELSQSSQDNGKQDSFAQSRERLPSLPIAIAQPSVPIAEVPERRQSGSAPAHISVEFLGRPPRSKDNEHDGIKAPWLDEDEEELSGIFH